MFTSKTILVLALAIVYICGCVNAEASCKVQLKQTLSTTWTDADGTFSVFQVAMENSGSSAVKSLSLISNSNNIMQDVWEMTETDGDDEMTLPSWRASAGIKVGETHQWGYIVKASRAADFVVKEVSCADGSSTQAPIRTSTPTPTTRSTSAPRSTPTPTPRATSAPPNTGSGRRCADGLIWSPAPGTTWQWQLTGDIDQSVDVQMYDVDLFDTSAAVIQQLHSKGRAVICYFSTQYENWRPDASSFPSSALGANLDDWPGERYVDIRSAAIRSIMTARLDLAKSKGCDGVEPDNVDGYSNPNGLGLTAANQLDYNKFLATQAHARGLSIGLKNDLEQVASLVSYFDWALDESCNVYKECSYLTPFVTAGKAVFGVEYTGSTGSFCPSMNSQKFSWLLKPQLLGADVTQCCSSASGGCKPVAYQCLAPKARRAQYGEEFIPDAELEAIEAALAPNPFEAEEIEAEAAELVEEPVAEEAFAAAEVFAEPVEEVVA